MGRGDNLRSSCIEKAAARVILYQIPAALCLWFELQQCKDIYHNFIATALLLDTIHMNSESLMPSFSPHNFHDFVAS